MFRIILKKLREEKGLAQHQLADLLGKSQSTVGMWESGKSYPDYATLIKLAEFFDVSVSYLIGETTQKEKTPFEEEIKKGTVQIKGYDGSLFKRELTDEQLDIVRRMVDQMPNLKKLPYDRFTRPTAARGTPVSDDRFDTLVSQEDKLERSND